MTIRFAAAVHGYNAILARALTASIPMRPANDNGNGLSSEKMLRAALRYFAEHGLSAAEHACENAEDALFAGDRAEYDWWLSICRTLDRRMADTVASRNGLAARAESGT